MLFRRMGVSILAAVVSCSMLLSGCGTAKKVETNATSTPEPKKDPVTLVWYGYNTPEKDHEAVIAELNKYLVDKINVKVEANFLVADDYKTKVPVLLSSGQKIDLVFTSAFTNPYFSLANNGTLEPLDDLLNQYGKKTLAMFDKKIWDGTKVNGKIYGVPSYKDLAASHYVYLNKDLVDKYKLDVSNIKTYEDLEPLLKVIKEKEPGIIPINIGRDYAFNYTNFEHMGGITNLPGSLLKTDKTTKIFNELEHPEFLKTAKKMREWAKAGYISADAAVKQNFTNEYRAGKVFASVLQSTPNGYLADQSAYGLKLIEKQLVQPAMGTTSALGALQAIPTNSKYKKEAMQLIELFSSDAYVNNTLRFGIENTHYKKIDDKFISLLPEGTTASDSKYYLKRSWPFGNMTLTYLPKGEAADKWDALKKFNESALITPSFGFAFSTEKVQTEIAACKTVWDEFAPSILSGAVEPEEYIAKANDKFKKAGLDNVLKEMQAQYDKFLASKK